MPQVEVRWADLDGLAGSIPGLHSSLDGAERARADRFRCDRDRARFIARRGLLRQLLGDQLGCEPGAVSYAVGPYGKPSLAAGGPRFSASHSHGVALFAVASTMEVGCDIERLDERAEIERLAEWLFAPGEVRALQQASPRQRRRAFFRYWTQKEAYVKGLGFGLSHPLDAFDLSGGAGGANGIPGWSVASLEPVAGFLAAVVGQSEGMEVTLRPFSCGKRTRSI